MSAADMYLAYAVETQAGIRPTSGYIVIPAIREMPEFNSEKFLDSILDYKAFVTDGLIEILQELEKMYQKVTEQGLYVWFCVCCPVCNWAIFYKGKPLPVGLPYIIKDSMYLGINLLIVPLSTFEKGKNPLRITKNKGSVKWLKLIHQVLRVLRK